MKRIFIGLFYLALCLYVLDVLVNLLKHHQPMRYYHIWEAMKKVAKMKLQCQGNIKNMIENFGLKSSLAGKD